MKTKQKMLGRGAAVPLRRLHTQICYRMLSTIN